MLWGLLGREIFEVACAVVGWRFAADFVEVDADVGIESTHHEYENVCLPRSLTRHIAWEILPDENPDDRARQDTARLESLDAGMMVVRIGAVAPAA